MKVPVKAHKRKGRRVRAHTRDTDLGHKVPISIRKNILKWGNTTDVLVDPNEESFRKRIIRRKKIKGRKYFNAMSAEEHNNRYGK